MRHRLAGIFFLCALALVPYRGAAQSVRIVASAQAPPELRGELLREAVDPCLGLHWQWIADPAHPEWPYHLVLVESPSAPAASLSAATSSHSAPASAHASLPTRVIRAGDLITVYQQTGAVNARFQALALDFAAAGQPLRARLTVSSDRSQGMNSLLSSTGPIITVTAHAPGEAIWSSGLERARTGESNQ